MMKLLEKYYNINYYCAYKLLFFLCWRLLNPLYWLSLLKWDNRYIKWCISIEKRQEAAEMDKGINGTICIWATHTPCIISFWMLCHLPLCLAFRSHRAVLVLCQSYIPVQARQVQEAFRRVR